LRTFLLRYCGKKSNSWQLICVLPNLPESELLFSTDQNSFMGRPGLSSSQMVRSGSFVTRRAKFIAIEQGDKPRKSFASSFPRPSLRLWRGRDYQRRRSASLPRLLSRFRGLEPSRHFSRRARPPRIRCSTETTALPRPLTISRAFLILQTGRPWPSLNSRPGRDHRTTRDPARSPSGIPICFGLWSGICRPFCSLWPPWRALTLTDIFRSKRTC